MSRIRDIVVTSIVMTALLFCSVLAGRIEVLRPGEILNCDEYDTLTWRTLDEPTENFLFNDPEESVAVWFDPVAPCSLIAIRFYAHDIVGDALIDVWDGSHYDGHITTTDSTDSDGWIGGFEDGQWIPGHVLGHSPIGWSKDDPEHHIWGSLPIILHEQRHGMWTEIPADVVEPHHRVYLGDTPFIVSVTFYPMAEGGLAAESEAAIPYHTLKYYSHGERWGDPGPDDEHYGWFLHSASVWVEAVVKYRRTTTIEEDVDVETPHTFVLFQNSPNPFNPTTSIRYSVVSDGSPLHVTLMIFNLLGQEVATLMDDVQETGYYTVTWDASEMSSGVYFCRITADDFTATKRMVLMK